MENKESFVELYNRLYRENIGELEVLRKQDLRNIKKIFAVIGGIILSFAIFGILIGLGGELVFRADGAVWSMLGYATFFIVGGILLVCIFFKLVTKLSKISKECSIVDKEGVSFVQETVSKKTYKAVFKENVISPIIKHVLNDSEYYHNVGLSKSEYNKGRWENYDRYDSEDKIITRINIGYNNDIKSTLTLSEIHTQDRRTDSDGDTHYVTLFYGLAGYINLPKDIGCYIKVINNKFDLFGKSKDNMQVDMSEFEKMFDVETNDKIKAMQLLTADVMSKLIELVNTSKVRFEFYINHDIMHIRFHTGELFEPEVFGKSMQFDNLKRYVDIVTAVKNITERICNIIQETEM